MITDRAAGGAPQRERDLRKALDHLNRGELAQADTCLGALLAGNATDAEALQLLGLVRQAQGRRQEAEQLYRRSLSVEPSQAHVFCNLGNLLKSLNRLDEAIEALREAIRLKPNYTEAHLILGLVHSERKDSTEAEKSYRQSLRCQPNYQPAKQALSAELNDMGRPQEAETLLRSALSDKPSTPRQALALEHNLAVSLKLQSRYPEALALFDSIKSRAPGSARIDYARATTLQSLGRFDEAIHSYYDALKINPLDFQAHADLNKLYYRLGDDERFLTSYDDVACLYPEMGMIPLEKAQFLFLQEQYDAARASFEAAARLMPDHFLPHMGLAMILAKEKVYMEAIREHEITIQLQPDSAVAYRNFAETLLRAGDAERAYEIASTSVALAPDNQGHLAVWSVALRLLDSSREKALNDYEKLVRVYEVPAPAGFGGTSDFNAALNAYLDDLHVDRRELIDQTLRKGTQTTGNLFGAGHAPVEALRTRIDEVVADYISRITCEDDHPLARRRSERFRYAGSWSARLHDCGFHTNHVHPMGWISSAYYVNVPDASAQSEEGWIKFGEPNFECGLAEPIQRKIKPEVGLLVLFPSYMWHGTIPFRSAQTRTTIAFDVVPARP